MSLSNTKKSHMPLIKLAPHVLTLSILLLISSAISLASSSFLKMSGFTRSRNLSWKATHLSSSVLSDSLSSAGFFGLFEEDSEVSPSGPGEVGAIAGPGFSSFSGDSPLMMARLIGEIFRDSLKSGQTGGGGLSSFTFSTFCFSRM